jgi:alpha-1,2-mannosyltransferase
MTAVLDRVFRARTSDHPVTGRFAAGLALFAISVAVYVWFTASFPGSWTHTDEFTYWSAGRFAVQHSADIYNVNFPPPGAKSHVPFIYPPFTAVLLALASPASFAVWQVGLVAADLAALPVAAYLALRVAGQRGMRAWAGALAMSSLAIWLQPVYQTLYFGQINLLLLLLVMADLALPDSSRWKGTGIGVAAGIKLTPLIFVPYLFASRRVRAGTVSLLAFAATIAIGFALMPAASREFWGGKFATPDVAPGRRQNQSLYGVALRLIHDPATAHTVWLAAAAVAGVAGLAVAVAASRRGMELLGIVVCAMTGLLVSEISWTHHWVWFVPALALTAGGTPARGRWLAARIAGTVAVAAVFFQWVVPHEMWSVLPRWLQEITPDVLAHTDLVVFDDTHDVFMAVGLLAIAGVAGYLWVTRRRPLTSRAGEADENPPPLTGGLPAR